MKKLGDPDVEAQLLSFGLLEIISSRADFRNRKNGSEEMLGIEINRLKPLRIMMAPYVKEFEALNGFVEQMIDKMEEFDFHTQPSVNPKTYNDNRGIETNEAGGKGTQPYAIYLKINLAQHTENVVWECVHRFTRGEGPASSEEKALLISACLLHDFGKSIDLAKAYGIDHGDMRNGFYQHERISEDYILLMAKSRGLVMDSFDTYGKSFRRLAKIVSQHHVRSSLENIDPLSRMLQEIDRAARTREKRRLEEEATGQNH